MTKTDTIMEDVKSIRKESTLEKHIQTILLSVTTMCIIGGFNRLDTMNEKLARMEEREKSKSEQISEIQAATNKMQLDIDRIKERITIIETTTSKK